MTQFPSVFPALPAAACGGPLLADGPADADVANGTPTAGVAGAAPPASFAALLGLAHPSSSVLAPTGLVPGVAAANSAASGFVPPESAQGSLAHILGSAASARMEEVPFLPVNGVRRPASAQSPTLGQAADNAATVAPAVTAAPSPRLSRREEEELLQFLAPWFRAAQMNESAPLAAGPLVSQEVAITGEPDAAGTAESIECSATPVSSAAMASPARDVTAPGADEFAAPHRSSEEAQFVSPTSECARSSDTLRETAGEVPLRGASSVAPWVAPAATPATSPIPVSASTPAAPMPPAAELPETASFLAPVTRTELATASAPSGIPTARPTRSEAETGHAPQISSGVLLPRPEQVSQTSASASREARNPGGAPASSVLPLAAAPDIARNLRRAARFVPGQATVARNEANGSFRGTELSAPAISAAAFMPTERAANSASKKNEKNFLGVTSESLKRASREAGIGVAMSPTSMPNSSTSFLERFAVSAMPVVSDVSFVAVSESGETLADNAARRAVAVVTAVADAAVETSLQAAPSVSLRFKVGHEDLAVRIQLRGGEVRAEFRTDSPELRAAVTEEWRVVSALPTSLLRTQEPVFTSSASAGSAGQGGASSQQGHGQSAHSPFRDAPEFFGRVVPPATSPAPALVAAPIAPLVSAPSPRLSAVA